MTDAVSEPSTRLGPDTLPFEQVIGSALGLPRRKAPARRSCREPTAASRTPRAPWATWPTRARAPQISESSSPSSFFSW